MDLKKIRYIDGKETRIEWTEAENGETSEHKRVSKQAPEKSFTSAFAAFVPLVVAACGLPKPWAEGLAIPGFSFGEEKAKGGGTRYNVIVHARYTPEAFTAPIFLNTPLLREAREEAEIGKPGYVPADWDDALETVRQQAIRFLHGKRFQADLPLAPAA